MAEPWERLKDLVSSPREERTMSCLPGQSDTRLQNIIVEARCAISVLQVPKDPRAAKNIITDHIVQINEDLRERQKEIAKQSAEVAMFEEMLHNYKGPGHMRDRFREQEIDPRRLELTRMRRDIFQYELLVDAYQVGLVSYDNTFWRVIDKKPSERVDSLEKDDRTGTAVQSLDQESKKHMDKLHITCDSEIVEEIPILVKVIGVASYLYAELHCGECGTNVGPDRKTFLNGHRGLHQHLRDEHGHDGFSEVYMIDPCIRCFHSMADVAAFRRDPSLVKKTMPLGDGALLTVQPEEFTLGDGGYIKSVLAVDTRYMDWIAENHESYWFKLGCQTCLDDGVDQPVFESVHELFRHWIDRHGIEIPADSDIFMKHYRIEDFENDPGAIERTQADCERAKSVLAEPSPTKGTSPPNPKPKGRAGRPRKVQHIAPNQPKPLRPVPPKFILREEDRILEPVVYEQVGRPDQEGAATKGRRERGKAAALAPKEVIQDTDDEEGDVVAAASKSTTRRRRGNTDPPYDPMSDAPGKVKGWTVATPVPKGKKKGVSTRAAKTQATSEQ